MTRDNMLQRHVTVVGNFFFLNGDVVVFKYEMKNLILKKG